MEGHPSGFKRTRIRVIRVRVNRVKITGKRGEIQRELDLLRVSGEFELLGFYCTKEGTADGDGNENENGKKNNRFSSEKQKLCTCITLFCTFLYRHSTTTT